MKITSLLENTAERDDVQTEHGLSLYIETEGHRILFDMGQTDAFARNAQTLGIDLSQVDIAILSHGHYDHGGGLNTFLRLNSKAPIYVHEKAFEAHHNASGKYIGVAPSLAEHPRIIRVGDRVELDSELLLCTCNDRIDGVPASARGMTVCENGVHRQDNFLHEQYLVITEGDKRVAVSGCSHKGILNIVRWLSPDVLIGGFHFMKLDPAGEDAAYLSSAADALLTQPCVYYTGHCTGEDAFTFLKARMGERLHGIHAGTVIQI